ncbi:hypothetical protein ACFT8Q_08415 [Streptomyces griseoincarnatus]
MIAKTRVALPPKDDDRENGAMFCTAHVGDVLVTVTARAVAPIDARASPAWSANSSTASGTGEGRMTEQQQTSVAAASLKEIAEKEDRDEFGQRLVDWGLRHIAARGWTTEDGTRTRIYLLRFDTAAVADDRFHGVLFPYTGPAHRMTGTENVVGDETFPEAATVAGVQRTVYDEAEPRGAEHDRQAYLVSGDVLAVVLQSRKGTAHAVPFRQTVVLQSQLLG